MKTILLSIFLLTRLSGSQIIAFPNGNGSLIENTPIGATLNWQCVSDDPPDLTTYVKAIDSTTKTDLYTFAACVPTTSSINSVTIYFRSRGQVIILPPNSTAKVKPVIKENGIISEGSEVTLTNSYNTFSQTWNARPSDGQPWTAADVNSIEAGVIQKVTNPGTVQARTTQVYLIVDYN